MRQRKCDRSFADGGSQTKESVGCHHDDLLMFVEYVDVGLGGAGFFLFVIAKKRAGFILCCFCEM
jgi:hypothetical protein